MKYGITIYSRYTGEHKILGSKFDTRKQAEEFTEKEICSRCNRIEIISVDEDSKWMDSQNGFLPIEEIKRLNEEKLKRKLIDELDRKKTRMTPLEIANAMKKYIEIVRKSSPLYKDNKKLITKMSRQLGISPEYIHKMLAISEK